MKREEIAKAAKDYEAASIEVDELDDLQEAFMQGAEWALLHQWRDIKEELPDRPGIYLVLEYWDGHPFCIAAQYDTVEKKWRPWEDIQVVGLPLDEEQTKHITHWMVMPATYTKEDGE